MRVLNYFLLISACIFATSCSLIGWDDEDNKNQEPNIELTSAPYEVGDYYNDGTKEGVVFEVSNEGYNGKIVCLSKIDHEVCWAVDPVDRALTFGLDEESDGEYNMAKVKTIENWEIRFPPFKWCADLGDGWYLPSKNEVITIWRNRDKIVNKLPNHILCEDCWSSTESSTFYEDRGVHSAWAINTYLGHQLQRPKNDLCSVRAVAKF